MQQHTQRERDPKKKRCRPARRGSNAHEKTGMQKCSRRGDAARGGNKRQRACMRMPAAGTRQPSSCGTLTRQGSPRSMLPISAGECCFQPRRECLARDRSDAGQKSRLNLGVQVRLGTPTSGAGLLTDRVKVGAPAARLACQGRDQNRHKTQRWRQLLWRGIRTRGSLDGEEERLAHGRRWGRRHAPAGRRSGRGCTCGPWCPDGAESRY